APGVGNVEPLKMLIESSSVWPVPPESESQPICTATMSPSQGDVSHTAADSLAAKPASIVAGPPDTNESFFTVTSEARANDADSAPAAAASAQPLFGLMPNCLMQCL